MKSIGTNSTWLRVCLALSVVLLGAAPAVAASVVVTPRSVSLRPGVSHRFAAAVYQTPNKAVRWSVNGIQGGNATLGRISVDGLYTAPAAPPGEPATVGATSVADPRAAGGATVTVLNPLPTISSVEPSSISPGPFVITVDGTGFVPTSVVRYGHTALPTTRVSSQRLVASGTAALVRGGLVAIRVANGEPGAAASPIVAISVQVRAPKVSAAAAARFLEQVSWGPDPLSIARVQQLGFAAYLDEQFRQPPSQYPSYATTVMTLKPVQQQFMAHALTGSDQLRQRVAFALGQILVVSGLKEFTPEMFVPWLRILSTHAFADYPTLVRALTLSPTMGHFLDMAHNEKASAYTGSAPNENYARELMQLFTIGTHRLNPNGTLRLDQQGEPIVTYDQAVVVNTARALTGWTYPTRPGVPPQPRNPPYFVGPLAAVPSLHDTDAKVLLEGVTLPAGQTPEQDLDAVLDLVLRHPNVGPFVARRLIQQLVTSNPRPAYVARVAAVYVATRGDLKSVVKAIVLDAEARRGDAGVSTPTDGHLREPVLFVLALLRSLGATLLGGPAAVNLASSAGQVLFYPPSVANYFPLDYALPGSDVRAPEFQILTPATAVTRVNVVFTVTSAPQVAGLTTDLSAFEPLASSPALLVEAVNHALMAGRMSPAMRTSIERAVAAASADAFSPLTPVETALFLVASSSEYQVQQ